MKFTGRIYSVVFLAFFNVTLGIYIYKVVKITFDTKILFIVFFFFVIAWVLGKKYDEVKFLSENDFLTKIHNRRSINRLFPIMSTKTIRNNEQLFVMVIDVDNFKKINDTYGHNQGDNVLKSLSKVLRANIRKVDLLARWGGDEFIILIPNTIRINEEDIINRFKQSISELKNELNFEINVSIGSSLFPVDGKSLEELISVADKRMYHIKEYKKT
ncbi:GGDEF domain-containing protein [Cytobacillus firmus]|uniref:GGDEF domain-containing protein n=1 Tax=Cytobacillus firmus TaxID=1399 RepID=UPI003696EFF8